MRSKLAIDRLADVTQRLLDRARPAIRRWPAPRPSTISICLR